MSNLKNFVGGVVHSSLLMGCVVVVVMGINLPLTITCSAASLIFASKLYDNLRGNNISNSIFSVSRNGKIVQNGMANPLKLISFLGRSKKLDIFKEEALKMFTQLKQKNAKGKEIVYNTKSQGMTLKLLKYLKNTGYIDNLEYTEAGSSRLLFEKVVFGNYKSIGKKNKIYNISFSLTDKDRNDLPRLLFDKPNDNNAVSDDNIVKKVDFSNVNKEKINYLKKLKEQLIYSKRKKYKSASYEEDIHKTK